MKYYSEILHKTFDTVEELDTAEKAEKENTLAKKKEEDARAKEINAAKEAVKKAREECVSSFEVYREKLSRLRETEQKLVDLEKKHASLTTTSTKDVDGDWAVKDLYDLLRRFL